MHVDNMIPGRDVVEMINAAGAEIDRLKKLVDLMNHQLGQKDPGVSAEEVAALRNQVETLRAERDEAQATTKRLEAVNDMLKRERGFLQSKLLDRAIATERNRFEEVTRGLDD